MTKSKFPKKIQDLIVSLATSEYNANSISEKDPVTSLVFSKPVHSLSHCGETPWMFITLEENSAIRAPGATPERFYLANIEMKMWSAEDDNRFDIKAYSIPLEKIMDVESRWMIEHRIMAAYEALHTSYLEIKDAPDAEESREFNGS